MGTRQTSGIHIIRRDAGDAVPPALSYAMPDDERDDFKLNLGSFDYDTGSGGRDNLGYEYPLSAAARRKLAKSARRLAKNLGALSLRRDMYARHVSFPSMSSGMIYLVSYYGDGQVRLMAQRGTRAAGLALNIILDGGDCVLFYDDEDFPGTRPTRGDIKTFQDFVNTLLTSPDDIVALN
jgi:hypothetical protein